MTWLAVAAVWLPRLTIGLGLFTALLGVITCSVRSWLEVVFVALSATTLALSVLGVLLLFVGKDALRRLRMIALGTLPLAGFWGLLYLPVQRTCDENYSRVQMHSNCKQLSIAIEYHHEAINHVACDTRDPAGKALLSWRVSILPFVDQAPLHNEFDRTQAWDSPRNRPLLEKPLWIFSSTITEMESTKTLWQGFVGPGTAFEVGKPLSLVRDFPDGLSETIMIVEAGPPVPWSKPADIPFGRDHPLPDLSRPYLKRGDLPFGGLVPDHGAYACMADGSVRFLQANISEETLRRMIVRNDGVR